MKFVIISLSRILSNALFAQRAFLKEVETKKNKVMQKINYLLIMSMTFLFFSCSAQKTDSLKNEPVLQIWKSKFYSVSLSYDSTWSKMPVLDSKEKILFGLIDKKDGKSLLLKIAEDVPQKTLSDSLYFKATKEQMLNANSRNKFLGESDTVLDGKEFHVLMFEMQTSKWGVLKQYGFIFRDGKNMISIQLSYPIGYDNIPEEQLFLLSQLKFRN